MNEWLGASGVAATAALAGLASVDLAAISVATLAGAGKITTTKAAAYDKRDHQGRLDDHLGRPWLRFAGHSGFGSCDHGRLDRVVVMAVLNP